MNRIQSIFRRYGWRTLLVVSAKGASRVRKVRDSLFLCWLKLATRGTKGTNISFGDNIEVSLGCQLDMGDDIYIGSRCIFEIAVSPSAHVTIDDDVWISHDCHICSYFKVEIGKHVLIGEFASIRDTTHNYLDGNKLIKAQGDSIGKITIEDDVWVGRGTIIIGRPEGIIIGRGAVIGANSVVSDSISPYTIVAGAPARRIGSRVCTEK